jgi:hypothetical protein
MIRITTAHEQAQTIIAIDGQLLSDYVDAVEACCAQAIAKGKPVQLFLRNVSQIDPCGRMLLCRLAGKGVDLKATGIYTSYVVDTLRQ